MLFSNDRIIFYGSFESSLIFPPPSLPASHPASPETRACVASSANHGASSNVAMVKYQGMEGGPGRGDRYAGSRDMGIDSQ